MKRKRLAWVLAVALLLSLLPVGGMAAQKDNKLGYKLFRGWNNSHSQMLQESNSTLLANTVVKVGSTTLSYGNGNATTVQNAKQHGISVTPPAGYYVAEVIIACNDNGGYNCNTAARSNLITFGAKSWNSTTFTITPAEMNQGAAAGKTVWHSGMGEPYWIMVRLAKSPDPVHVVYDAGAMKNEIGASTALVENGNDFQITNMSGNATHQALPIKAAYEKVAQNGKTYRFTGWKVEYYVNYNNGELSNFNANGGTVQPGANVKLSLHAKLTAQWKEVKTYRVFYDANGGEGTMTDATLYATGDAITVKANEFTYTHKQFAKFTLDAAGTQNIPADFRMGSSDITLYAQWEDEPTYRVFYDANGGDGTMTDEQQYYTGDAITVKANEFTYAHKQFAKFTLDAAGTQDIPADFQMGSSHITLYAQWEDEPTYRVFYDANGGEGTMTDEQLYYTGDAIAVKANEFTYTHKKFVKFTLDAAGTQDIPADFQMGSSHITLYAQWEAEPTYRVFYDANGGTGTMTDEQLYYTGDAITVLKNAFERADYTFVKFTLDKEGMQDIPADFRMKEGNITLYAQWMKKEKPSVTPVTGDSANLALWAGAMLLSCAGIVLLSQMKKRAHR